jgi:hypothetical protein
VAALDLLRNGQKTLRMRVLVGFVKLGPGAGIGLAVHEWLQQDKTDHLRQDVEALNNRVYAELFLTPDFDAWLGLVPDDTYTALEKDGCACEKGAPPMR